MFKASQMCTGSNLADVGRRRRVTHPHHGVGNSLGRYLGRLGRPW